MTTTAPAVPTDHGLTPGQIRRASNVVMGLIFKGMNDYCAREIDAYKECDTFFSNRYASKTLEGGECGREREFLGTCRVLVADSMGTQCRDELSALTLAVGKKEGNEAVQQLTDRLYKCGMTPVPGLDDGLPRRLPGTVERGIIRVYEEQKERAEFVKVVQKQLEEEQSKRRGTSKPL